MEKFESLGAEKTPISPQVQTSVSPNANIRTMPIIVPANFSSPVFLFSSVDSCAIYQQKDYKKCVLNSEGIGIPLFETRFRNFNKGFVSVDKYVLLNVKDPPPKAPYRIKKQDGNLILYKVEYCKAYLCDHKNYSAWEVAFSAPLSHVGKYDFIQDMGTRPEFFGTADGFDLSWKAFGSIAWGGRELFANYDDIHRLITYDSLPDSEPRDDNCKGKPLSPQGIYSRNWKSSKLKDSCSMLSFLEPGDASGLGIRSVPPVTEFLSIHGILLHFHIVSLIQEEERRARAARNAAGSGSAAGAWTASFGGGF
ncbi:ZYRO0F02134p [Zygosaccharomyces rouxii]|uniref:ZYRO0F02134p n=1 Tax=Zygosaccharomyces rouxii (strain ATCC 2623 / CBS 732 / NBRC 1130 / NCYC 568 / NRRL Y-229) TaxID=559307 RepID=C5DX45_ZYGRC|nr:uncharacterized protein ZYRO0F02134g [Zygosaccharomyces rouxii]KAH9199119.1 hypothetical protein LQ764DRAFT_225379 [Zygosaccharomyces rouxii]CAR28356.1 ZYRO0F02134p [Zygosaccharomyces rouxii]